LQAGSTLPPPRLEPPEGPASAPGAGTTSTSTVVPAVQPVTRGHRLSTVKVVLAGGVIGPQVADAPHGWRTVAPVENWYSRPTGQPFGSVAEASRTTRSPAQIGSRGASATAGAGMGSTTAVVVSVGSTQGEAVRQRTSRAYTLAVAGVARQVGVVDQPQTSTAGGWVPHRSPLARSRGAASGTATCSPRLLDRPLARPHSDPGRPAAVLVPPGPAG